MLRRIFSRDQEARLAGKRLTNNIDLCLLFIVELKITPQQRSDTKKQALYTLATGKSPEKAGV